MFYNVAILYRNGMALPMKIFVTNGPKYLWSYLLIFVFKEVGSVNMRYCTPVEITVNSISKGG